MPLRSDGVYSFVYGEPIANRVPNNQRTSEPLSASTKKLFDAIYDENLEAFKQALADGADVNAFDEEGMTPLMSIANTYITSNDQPTLEKVAKLLIQNRSININAQSKQSVSTTRSRYDLNIQDEISELIVTPNKRRDTILHIACLVGAKDIVKMLLTHPNVETDVRNCEYKSPVNCIARGSEGTIKLEFEKAQKGKQLLNALAGKSIYQAKTLLNQELNPNCWSRNQNGEIETPLSLIIKSCLQTITRDKEEVLTKLLKHKELDFSQAKPIPAIEQSIQLKRIIEQAIKGRLIDTINKKDLDDVKKLVEDNCFMSYAIIAAALRDVGNPIESIANYLNEKFPASVKRPLAGMSDIPVGFEEFVQELVNGLEEVKVQLAEKEKELNGARQELNKRNDEIGKQQNRILELERELHHAKIRLASGSIGRSMSRAIFTAASGNVNKKFPASAERPLVNTDSTPVGFEQGVAKLADKLENVQAQLIEKEKELRDVEQELNKRNNEIREQQNRISELKRELDQAKAQLTEKERKLNNIIEESRTHRIGKESDRRAISSNRKQNNYALTFFILSGAFVVGTCLTIVDYPEVSAGLAAVALGLFLVGYFLYKGDEKDIGPVSTTDSPQVTRIFISSPDSAESFYTY
ncbi:MAG: hypothetical protein LKM45_00905 [Wolbachia endosymbiont of Alcedoecus sp.]|nr:hypothetical protein [Wolbachia endosymbiont of Alcedoecus sp.]